MRMIFADERGEVRPVVDVAEVVGLREKGVGLLWIDLDGSEAPETLQAVLVETFAFHPLAVDDALTEQHVPKVDDWEGYLYLVLRDVVYDTVTRELRLPELDIFLGRGYLVTYHLGPLPALDRVWELSRAHRHWLTHNADHLLYRLMDELANRFLTVVEAIEDELDDVETRIFPQPQAETLETLFDHKRTVLRLRRVLLPQRDVAFRLAQGTYQVIGPKDRVYFSDVYDHMVRLYDLAEGLRDLVAGAVDVYLSVVNNRMNDVMKTLTVITTLFMPLTFLTGFFGMNFFGPTVDLGEWTGRVAFGVTMVIMVVLPLTMFWWMRRRAWL